MTTKNITLSLNEKEKFRIARLFDKTILSSNKKEINIIITRLEEHFCRMLEEKIVDIENASNMKAVKKPVERVKYIDDFNECYKEILKRLNWGHKPNDDGK